MSVTSRAHYFTIALGILCADQLSSKPPNAIYPLLTVAGDLEIIVTGPSPHNTLLPHQALEYASTKGTGIRCSEPKCH